MASTELAGRGAVLLAALQYMAATPGQRGFAASGRVPPDVTGPGAAVNIFA